MKTLKSCLTVTLIILTADNPTTGQVIGLDSGTMQIVWAKTLGRTSIDEYHHASPTIGPDGRSLVVSNNAGDVYRLAVSTAGEQWHKTGYAGADFTIVFSRDNSLIYVSHGTAITA